MFPEVRGECEELNTSPQIEAAADGRLFTRYAANSRSKDGERESLETKDGDRESLETQGGEQESLETSRARQECRVQKRITGLHRTLDSPLNFGPGEEVPHLGSGAAHRRATSITGISGTTAVGGTSMGSGTWRTSGSTRSHGLWTQSGEIQRAMRNREITVPGGPI